MLGQKADKSEVTESVTAAVAQIVANAPEDFNTLQEMSDWIASHEDSAASMNTAILQNTADIEAVEAQQTEQSAVISVAKEGVALNQSTLGYQSKNLLKNMAKSQTINGVTFTVNEDGSVTIHGTNTDTEKTAYITLNSHIKTVYGQKYTASIATDQISGVYMSIFDSQWVGAGRCNPKITFTENKNDGRNIRLSVEEGATVKNVTVYPMLRYADITDDTYEPYKPSVQEQIDVLISRISALESSQTDTVTSQNMADEIITMNVEDEKHERTKNLEQTD